ISRKRRRTRLRTTAPPTRREVTNPAREAPESSTGATFNVRNSPRFVVPVRLTCSYSDRRLRRRLFGNENEPLGAICTANPARSTDGFQDEFRQSPLREMRGGYKRSLPPKARRKTPQRI